MKTKDLTGREHQWKLKVRPTSLNKSSYHIQARELLVKRWPGSLILEEVYLPGINLYADFYVVNMNLIVEVHGNQHYVYNQHFHGSRKNFASQQIRDGIKQEWCRINKIKFLELSCRETLNEWTRKLNSLYETGKS